MKLLSFSLLFLLCLPLGGWARGELPSFADLIEDKSPAVVKITTTATMSEHPVFEGPQSEEIPEFFHRFFDENMPERSAQGMGSGFIISRDGYVLTNHHVVDGASEIVVRLLDRRELIAEVIGSDRRSDLALLKIDAKKLPYLQFADAEKLRVGDWVLAIGSPFGMDFSASQGIVSAIGRSLRNSQNDSYVPFIQTDVAINPGNSGGPLFNLDGEVVGINSQIFTQSGGYMGLSFAIPASLAQSVVTQLKEKGRVDRGWLGVAINDMDRDLAQAFGLSRPAGALVEHVLQGGPAEQAGIRPGDVILKFNGITIDTAGELPPVVGEIEPGSRVPVLVMREGKEQTIQVNVGTLDSSNDPMMAEPPAPAEEPAGDRLGLRVEPPSKTMLDELSVTGGVVVVDVLRDSPAAKAGLEPGDVIVQLGFNEVSDMEGYQQQIEQLPTDTQLPVRFFRDGQPAFRSLIIRQD